MWFVRHEGVEYEVIREPGFVTSDDRQQAFLLGPGQPVFQVNLRTMSSSRHRTRPALPSVGQLETASLLAADAGDNLIAYSGGTTTFPLHSNVRPRSRAFGLRFLSTRTWTTKTVARFGDSAPIIAGGTIVVFRFGSAIGFDRQGLRRFSLRDPRLNPDGTTFACGHYLYFQTDYVRAASPGRIALVLDTNARTLEPMNISGRDLIWIDSPCSESR